MNPIPSQICFFYQVVKIYMHVTCDSHNVWTFTYVNIFSSCTDLTSSRQQKPKESAAKRKTASKDATTSTLPEKPVLNYLRPTTSPCQNSCQHPIKRQPLAVTKPAGKASPQSSSQPKDRTHRPISQLLRPSSVTPKASEKAFFFTASKDLQRQLKGSK